MNRSYPKQNRILRILPLLIFFLLSLFYFFRITDYIFFYQEKSSLFLFSFQYLLEHLNQPGGFLIYLGELQTTFYYYPFVGAVLVSLEICLIIVLTSKIGKILSGRSIFIIPYLMGAVLFYLQTNYQYSSFNNLGVLIQLLFFFVILKYLKGKFIWIPVVLFPLQYFLFGSFLFILLMLFSIFILLNEKQKGWIKLAILYSFSLGFFFMGKEFLFFQTTNTLLVYPYSAQGVGWQSTLFITAIISISILPLLFLITAKRLSSFSFKKIALIQFVPFLIIFVLVFLAVPRIDKKNREYFHVAKLFYQQKYDEIIEFNRQFPSTNILTNFLNNVALSETGQLSNSFFSFPQSADGGTLFLKWEIVSEVLKRGGYFYYNLGMINEAQRWAYEYMVMRGNSPEALKMLIKTDLINGNFKIAKKYITILKQSLFYRKQALEYEELLFNETAINNHPELGRKTQLKTTQDFFVISDDPSANLDLILEADSMNIIAMEYKLSKLLLQKDMQGIVDELPNLEKMGYSKIPKNVEEAVVTYKMLKVGEMPKLKRLKINRQTEQRFQQYYKIYQQNQANKQQAQRVLMPNFGDTYWYYVFFK
jgi:hypothetical protein